MPELPSPIPSPSAAKAAAGADDAVLVRRILDGDEQAFELLMRRHNQLLFRAARAVMGNPFDAEDVLQEAYVKALGALGRFEGRSSLATWLVRIVVNEALTRAGRARRVVPLHSVATVHDEVADDDSARASGWLGDSRRGPELAAGDRELRAVLSDAVDRLPEAARTVFTLRCVEELSVEETAECLDVSPEVVRVRLHRARAALREDIGERLMEESRQLFSFGHEHCDRVVARVLERVRREGTL